MTVRRKYDLELFLALNDEYKDRPVVPKPPQYDRRSRRERAEARANQIHQRFGARNKRILEIGCGSGDVLRALADLYGSELVGLDINENPSWTEAPLPPNLALHRLDVTRAPFDHLGRFDLIVSYAVWEHVEHPYAGLRAVKSLLAPGGTMYMIANLYRGPRASHRYAEVYFPWPHLLFEDEVFEAYYRSIRRGAVRAAWVNKLTAAQYLLYFDLLDLTPARVRYDITPIDEPFYERFLDRLGRYPRFDLERDFIHVELSHRTAVARIRAEGLRVLDEVKPHVEGRYPGLMELYRRSRRALRS